MRPEAKLLLASILLLAPWGALAQQKTFPDKEIDCSLSRFVALPNVRCFNTDILPGGNGNGQFQVWRLRGKEKYLHVRLLEAIFYRSNIVTALAGTVDHLKSIDPRAKAAAGMTGITPYNGADYVLFTATNGEECAGFRRNGPIRLDGYAWIIGGVTCEPKGRGLSPDQARAFVDSVRLK